MQDVYKRQVDIRLGVLIQVDDLCVAAALEVEDAVVVPAVLVIADEQTLRVGGQGGLAGAGQTEEDGSVLALLIGVGRACLLYTSRDCGE